LAKLRKDFGEGQSKFEKFVAIHFLPVYVGENPSQVKADTHVICIGEF
jgi:hypothetical protein